MMATPFYCLSSLILLNISRFLHLLHHNLFGNKRTNTKKVWGHIDKKSGKKEMARMTIDFFLSCTNQKNNILSFFSKFSTLKRNHHNCFKCLLLTKLFLQLPTDNQTKNYNIWNFTNNDPTKYYKKPFIY